MNHLSPLLDIVYSEKKILLWAFFFTFLNIISFLAYPFFLGVIVDTMQHSQSFIELKTILLLMLVVIVIGTISTIFKEYYFHIAGEKIIIKFREKLYANIMQQEIVFFDRYESGYLTNRLTTDTSVLEKIINPGFANITQRFFSFAFASLLMLYLSPLISLFLVVVSLPALLFMEKISKKVKSLGEKTQEVLAQANAVATESFSGIHIIKAFFRENFFQNRYRNFNKKYLESTKEVYKLSSSMEGIYFFIGEMIIVVIIWCAIYFISSSTFSVGSFIAFITYARIVAHEGRALSRHYLNCMRVFGATKHIFELIHRTSKISSGTKTIENLQGSLVLDKVNFCYPSRCDLHVLKDISFTINSGEIVAFMGPSGQGKSTIANLILRFYDPGSGRILIDGHDLLTLDINWFRCQVGIVTQECILFSTTIYENISFGYDKATKEDIIEAATAANAHEFIESFPQGYETQVGERGVKLSGGQKQRITIARALLRKPSILILDEATSALDCENEFSIYQSLAKLSTNGIVIIITHRLSVLQNVDKIFFVKDGCIQWHGQYEEFETSPMFEYVKTNALFS